MIARLLFSVVFLSLVNGLTALAAGLALAPSDKEPLLRVEAGGPTSYVTSLAFSANGTVLYAGGWDKVIRVWALNEKGEFVPGRVPAYRLPIGPGLDGAINALAVSDDGVWLAAAGSGVFRDAAGFRTPGFIVPTYGGMTPEMRLDLGTIYVFNTQDQTVRLLRGHEGTVVALAFAPKDPAKPPLLLSAARERDVQTNKFHSAVRLWDVDKGQSQAVLSSLPNVAFRPGIAVWNTTTPGSPVRAALALSDGVFRIWDSQHQGKNLREIDVAKYTMTVAPLPDAARTDRTRLLTAEYGDQTARLTLWEVAGTGEPKATAEEARPVEANSFPQALGLLASKVKGGPDLAAAIVRVPKQQEQYRLQILDLDPEHFGTVRAEKLLWQGAIRQPVLATSLHGKYLAVAGNADHQILIYELSALLRHDMVSPQRLRSSGVIFHHVSFASKGNDLALLLNRSARKRAGQPPPAVDPDKGDLLFDFGKRRLTADSTGWKIATPDLRGWRVQQADREKRSSVSVFRNERLLQQINLAAGEELSDYALLPPQGANQVPLLAVATHKLGQPRLVLYNAASGELVRQFTGHVDRLYALAFSADGRLLVSAAEDQTVCVWSLTDLDQVLGRRGLLPGVVVRLRHGALEVAELQDAGPAARKLRVGDVLAGVVEKGKLRPLTSPLAFYEAVFRMEPGQKVTLRRSGPQRADDITLDVGQGVDERKPLLSLFVLRDEKSDKVEDGEWIGWNPVGPYEASSPKAERFLGWHFNTGDDQKPTRFALASAHHKDYYREGILHTLISQGTLGHVETPPLPAPSLVLVIEEGGRHRPPEGADPLRVSHSHINVKLEVRDRPLNTLEALTWKLDDLAEQKLGLDAPNAQPFVVPLDLRRGDHKVVITAWTRDMPPRPTQKQLALRYQPPPPRVKRAGGINRPLFVQEAAFDLQALVYPGLAGEAVQVAVHHWHGQKDLLAERNTHSIDPERPLVIAKRLQLRPGNNLLEVVAVNRNAPRGLEAVETDRLMLEVFYVQKARPPDLSLTGVRLLSRAESKVLKIEPHQPVVVHAPVVRLEGTIDATENLLQAEWDRGSAARMTSLTGFKPNKAKQFTFREELRLRPGPQTFHLQTRAATSDVSQRVVTIDYRPLPPDVRLLKPRTGHIVYGEQPTTVVQLQGRIDMPEDRQVYRATVLLNDRELAEGPVMDEQAGTWTAAVTLAAGNNRIRIKLSNAWGMVSYSEETEIRYLRPPRIVELRQVPGDGKPVLNVDAQVRSPLRLLRGSVRVEVNGQAAPAVQIAMGEPQGGAQVLQLRDVPLEAGSKENNIRVWVSNAEAECRDPGLIVIQTARVLPPPVIEFLQPRQNLAVSRPELPLRFQIRSLSALTKVQLLVEGRPPLPVNLPNVQRDAEGQFLLTADMDVELLPGLNYVRLEAHNAGGRQITPPLAVTYVRPPLQIAIDGLVPSKPPGKPVLPQKQPHGRIAFPEAVEHGQVQLHGRILWADDKAAQAHENVPIRVFVNGFQQPLARFKRSAGASQLQTPFEADLLLNRDKDNHVRLAVPGQDAADHTEFVVDCRQPVKQQRLRLLTLSPRGKDGGELTEQVLQAIHSSPTAQELKAPAFEEVKPYGPLVGWQVEAPFIYGQLFTIKTEIDVAREGSPMNDVVMIYYQGGEAINEHGNFFQTYAGQGQGTVKEFGMPCDELVQFLAETGGAHVLLLDVDRYPPAGSPQPGLVRDKIVHWKDDYPQAEAHVGVLRDAWLGKTDPPRETRLITTMGKIIPQAGRLSQVVALMEKTLATLRNSDVVIYTYVPNDLQGLLVGAAHGNQN